MRIWFVFLIFTACNITTDQPNLDGQDIHVTFIHTSDIHSRLLPYRMKVPLTDKNLGLNDANQPFGGAARMAYIIKKERMLADRSLYIDTGDSFQGAPIFNVFLGEVEYKVLSEIGLDVMCLGNHDFDAGAPNLADKLMMFANFPVLAANYKFAASQSPNPPPLSDLVKDYEVFNLNGFRIGVIGLGNTSTMSTIVEAGNALGIIPIDAAEVVQFYIDLIRPHVDVIVVASHLGLTEDEELIHFTTGIDIVFGGHHHVVLNPPKVIPDCQIDMMDEYRKAKFLKTHKCTPRNVPLVHSGAFAKYVGRLDVVFRQSTKDKNDFEVASYKYKVIPVDSTVTEDQRTAELIEPYKDILSQVMQLDLILGYAPSTVRRFGVSGDSALGNVVANAMRERKGVETDFALTNALGIRTDIYPGPVTVDVMYQVFPFDNTITTMYLSGREVVELFDYVARRTTVRGCTAQAQISGAKVVLHCGGCDCSQRPVEWDTPERRKEICSPDFEEGCALKIEILGKPVELNTQYQLAANNYIAKGGSGFMVLKRNTTQINTGIPQRDALIDYMRQGKPCGRVNPCSTDADCDPGYICGCGERARWKEGLCVTDEKCPEDQGRCVLAICVSDVTKILEASCLGGEDDIKRCQCEQKAKAMGQCASLPCIDPTNGFVEDGRIKIILSGGGGGEAQFMLEGELDPFKDIDDTQEAF